MNFVNEDKDNNQVIIFDNVVYDVKEYAPQHPGGKDYILDRLGKDIKDDFEEFDHTKNALKNLLSLPIVGTIGDDANSTDSDVQWKNEETKFGVASLYGMKFDNKMNEKMNFDYNKGLFY